MIVDGKKSSLVNIKGNHLMKDHTEVASFRVPVGTVAELKLLAHKRSLEEGRDITWSGIVRNLIVDLLRQHGIQEMMADRTA
jgi:hypothetical protein